MACRVDALFDDPAVPTHRQPIQAKVVNCRRQSAQALGRFCFRVVMNPDDDNLLFAGRVEVDAGAQRWLYNGTIYATTSLDALLQTIRQTIDLS